MIPATTPRTKPAVDEITYDQWTPVGMSGSRLGEGRWSHSVRLHRSRLLESGNTELAPDDGSVPDVSREIVVPDIYAPAGTHGQWWTTELRAAVMQAAGGIIQATAGIGYAKGVL